jgi:type IV pilus assembly protein PilP
MTRGALRTPSSRPSGLGARRRGLAPASALALGLRLGLGPGLALALTLGAAGCGDDDAAFTSREAAFGGGGGASGSPVGPSTDTTAGKAAAVEVAKVSAPPSAPSPRPAGAPGSRKAGPAKVYTDAELEAIAAYVVTPEPPMDERFFAEAIDNRDPFRPFVPEAATAPDEGPKTHTDCVLSSYSIDELKLIGIITGIAAPRATFVDPAGTGWAVRKGDCLGRTGARITRMAGDEITVLESSPSTGTEVERVLKLHPGAIDLRKALKGGDPMALKGAAPLPSEAGDGLGVAPGLEGVPVGPKPKLEVGMSKANFVKNYGKCFAKRSGLGLLGAGSPTAEVWGRSSSAGECADVVGGLIIVDKGRVISIQAL